MSSCWNEPCRRDIAEGARFCAACGEPQIIGDFTISGFLGKGATQQPVYHSTDSLERRVAIKVLRGATDPAKRQRFLTEARACARLKHAAVQTLYAASFEGADAFIVTEFVNGTRLDVRHEATELSLAEALRLTLALLDALDHAHSNGVIHRDLSPWNVLLRQDSGEIHPVLIDFGLARFAGSSSTELAYGASPGYGAPEQVLDTKNNDHRSDLYGVGAILYWLVCHRVPYIDAQLSRISEAIYPWTSLMVAMKDVQDGRIDLEQSSRGGPIREDLNRFFARALAPRVDLRFQDAQEMRGALESIAAVVPGALNISPLVTAGRLDELVRLMHASIAQNSAGFDVVRLDRGNIEVVTAQLRLLEKSLNAIRDRLEVVEAVRALDASHISEAHHTGLADFKSSIGSRISEMASELATLNMALSKALSSAELRPSESDWVRKCKDVELLVEKLANRDLQLKALEQRREQEATSLMRSLTLESNSNRSLRKAIEGVRSRLSAILIDGRGAMVAHDLMQTLRILEEAE